MAISHNDWIKEYINFIKKGDLDNALSLKYSHHPTCYYKFRALTDYNLECIENDWLWISKIEHLNDLFESSLTLNKNEISRMQFTSAEFMANLKNKSIYSFTNQDFERIKGSLEPYKTFRDISKLKGVLITETDIEQQLEDEWQKFQVEQNEFIRICSFGTSYESLLMWSHYSDQHKGICIEYDFSNSPAINYWMTPIHYSEERCMINSIPEMNSVNKFIATMTKSKDWQYEQEWRFILYGKTNVELVNNRLNVPTPIAIYLGPRFYLNPEDKKQRLLKVAQHKKIPTYNMTNHNREYKLTKLEK